MRSRCSKGTPSRFKALHYTGTDHDEWWYIVEGEYKFEVDGREIYARPGATVFAPRGSAHTFQNVGIRPGRTLATVVPGGVDLFSRS